YLAANPAADKQSVDFLRGAAYMNAGTFDTAEAIFYELRSYKDAYNKATECAINISNEYLENEDALAALDILRKYDGNMGIPQAIEKVSDSIYQQGLSFFSEKNYFWAREYFDSIPGYLDSELYSIILHANSYADMAKYADQDIVQNFIYSSIYLIPQYLKGNWSNGDYYFNINDDYYATYNIPLVNPSAQYYDITEDGIYMHDDAKCFKFDIIDANTMDIYAYKNNQTYHMSRQ
ncbi:MAG: hypothetical protein RR449_08395, partial [Christensenella sp.]